MENKTKLALGAAIAGAFALGLTVMAYTSAQEDKPGEAVQSKAPTHVSTEFSQLEEDQIRAIIRNYLMSNPEIIIEAVQEYSAREQQRAETLAKETAAANLNALLDPKTSFVAGKNPAKAKVAVIELFDYHCGFCKRAAPLLKELTDQSNDIKVVFRELPILREESDYAAEVSLAARDQGKFLEMHFAMMEASGVLTKDRIASIASDVGIDMTKLEKSRQQAIISQAIVENHRIAAQMGVEGTPAFIVASLDGSYVEVVNGFRPQELVERIEAARKASNE